MKYRRTASPRPQRPAPPPLPASGAAIDLHLHSQYSDGAETPAALVRQAKEAGLHAIALTDHDSVRGIPEAREACRAHGLTLVPGVELGVGLGDDEIHLLGYGIDAGGRSLQHALELVAGERVNRMERMVAILRRQGVAITLEDVQAEARSEILGRPHLADALVRKGLVADQNAAFQRWLATGRPAYVRRSLITLREAIDLIREAGGVAVMAHPGLTRRDELIEYLVRLGVRGLEVYHPRHDFVDVARYRKTCARFDLFATGGSDYHGPGRNDVTIGCVKTPPDEFDKMLKFMHLYH